MNEKIYDEQIAPLMQKIIDICQQHGIPMFVDFQLSSDDDPLYCASSIPGSGSSLWFKQMQHLLMHSVPSEFLIMKDHLND